MDWKMKWKNYFDAIAKDSAAASPILVNHSGNSHLKPTRQNKTGLRHGEKNDSETGKT